MSASAAPPAGPLAPHLEHGTVEGQAGVIGRDPRRMTPADLAAAGREHTTVLAAVRAKCLDCCCGSVAETRRCRDVKCDLWPFRMGTNPWRPSQSEENREKSAARMRALHARRVGSNVSKEQDQLAGNGMSDEGVDPSPDGAPGIVW